MMTQTDTADVIARNKTLFFITEGCIIPRKKEFLKRSAARKQKKKKYSAPIMMPGWDDDKNKKEKTEPATKFLKDGFLLSRTKYKNTNGKKAAPVIQQKCCMCPTI